ncbi:hypothetical protein PG291_08800 [Riemerella anatipestifer]|nr:hypothetical protein [Riemerella anatipestifer]
MNAVKKEIEKKYIEAINMYEYEISANKNVPVDYFINLAFLYWCFAFENFEFIIPNDIPKDLINKGGERFMKIIYLGQDKYPDNLELLFWKRYFLHISYGENFTYKECIELIKNHQKEPSDIPYFFLYQYDKEMYKSQKNKLLKNIEKEKTAKNLYIISILSQQ